MNNIISRSILLSVSFLLTAVAQAEPTDAQRQVFEACMQQSNPGVPQLGVQAPTQSQQGDIQAKVASCRAKAGGDSNQGSGYPSQKRGPSNFPPHANGQSGHKQLSASQQAALKNCMEQLGVSAPELPTTDANTASALQVCAQTHDPMSDHDSFVQCAQGKGISLPSQPQAPDASAFAAMRTCMQQQGQ